MSDRVCVDQTSEEDKWYEMVVENFGIEVEVGGDQSPSHEEWYEAEEGTTGTITSRATSFDDVERSAELAFTIQYTKKYLRLNSVQNQYNTTLEHPPLVKGQFVDIGWNERVVGDTKSLQQRLLPEACSTLDCSESVDKDENDDSFNRSRNEAEGESFGMVFVPGLNVKGQKS